MATENPDDVHAACSPASLHEGSNKSKRLKLEEVEPPSKASGEESHHVPHQPSNHSLNDGQTQFREKWHIFKEDDSFFKDRKRIVKALLFPPSQVNDSVPAGCNDEMSFLIDVSKLRFSEDLTCDENGKYCKPSKAKSDIILDESNNVLGSKKCNKSGKAYTLVRKYYIHKDTPAFHRTIYELHEKGNVHPVVIVRYKWRGEKTELKFTPHGNQKHSDRPFIRSKKEMIEDLKTTGGSSAQKVMNDFYQRQGGSDSIHSFSSVPRDRKQVYRYAANKGKGSDFRELLEKKRRGVFVKSVEFCHGEGKGIMPKCVLYSEKQMQDIKRNCCQNGSIFTFDSTFECGPMFVTIGSYRNRSFVNESDNKSVLMPGPILLHARRDVETYRYFGNEMSKALQNSKVLFLGTDGETALHEGIAATPSFSDALHLQCMIHHRRNCESKLAELGVQKNARRILRSIYGEQDSTRSGGLADCDTEEEYDERLVFWAPQWDTLESGETGKGAEFSTWFRHFKSAVMKTSMLKPLRSKAGLGDPPRQFSTNDAVSMNAMVSRWICGKKSWDELAQSLKEFVDSKFQELEMAVLGLGERKLHSKFQHLQKTPVQWRNMTGEERREVLQQTHLTTDVESKGLSITPDESGIHVCGFTSNQLEDVWQKAGRILASPENIVYFPNNEKKTICFSEDTHYTVTQEEAFVCDNTCRSFMFYERLICEHCLAVADRKGVLNDFLSTIASKKHASAASLVNKDLQEQCFDSGREEANEPRGANVTIKQEIMDVDPEPATHQPFSVARKVGPISRCYGCMQSFNERMNKPPQDLILRKLDLCQWTDKKTGEMWESSTPVPTHYHLNMDCVHKRYPLAQVKDILLHDGTREQLHEVHINKLRHFGLNTDC